MEAGVVGERVFAFGRFNVVLQRREVLADGERLELGDRAFDLLIALIDSRGAVISKDDLMRRAWPGRIVEENSLQAQISALRKAFGADRDLIRTVAGRGYQFVGQVRASTGGRQPATNVPERVSELIGRDAQIRDVLELLAVHRLVTLTGAGGVGKTQLALEIARRSLAAFPDGVWVAQLAPLSHQDLVPATVASAVGLTLVGGS
ncbi:MAG TPA: winged helix-turn-helix domain-containing protein, partial [Burkholderiales bacterium]|nr:winged helix-turn-helix domain-containing protein [Burkholderiales bacterium]